MNSVDIAFPNLGIYLKNVPKTFMLGKFSIAMYGIIFAIGVLAGIYVASNNAKKEGLDDNVYWDFAIIEVIFSLLGARIYYVIFAWDFYKDNLLSVFKLREGGLAIYGAVIAAFIVLFVFCYQKKLNPFIFGDTAMPGLILGQAIGRWGNFFNREVFGEYTNNIFAMSLPVDAIRARDISELQAQKMAEAGVNYIQCHPTFLYESVCNLLIFAGLMLYRKHKKFNGELCLLYFASYGVARFVIEGIRTDQLKMIGTNIPVSQVVAIILIVIAVVGEVVCRVLIAKKSLPDCFRVRTFEENRAAAAKQKEAATARKNARRGRVEYIIKEDGSREAVPEDNSKEIIAEAEATEIPSDKKS